MANILIQFHALPCEVTALVKQCVEDFNLHAVAMKYFLYEVVEVGAHEMTQLSEPTSSFRNLAITLEKPVLSLTDNFKEQNPSCLQIGLEKIGVEGLRQIALSARTDDLQALSVWKKIAKRLKSITRTGVVAVNSDTGEQSPVKTFRYTAGAKAAALAGVRILPFAGGGVLLIPED